MLNIRNPIIDSVILGISSFLIPRQIMIFWSVFSAIDPKFQLSPWCLYHTFIGKAIGQTSVKMFVFSDAGLIRILPYFVSILNWLDYVENVRLIRAYNEFTNCIQMGYVTHRKEIAVFRHSRRTLFHLNETLLLLIVIIVYKHQFVY